MPQPHTGDRPARWPDDGPPHQVILTSCKVNLTSALSSLILASMVEHVLSDVRKLRFLNGEMTQEELARRVGVSRQTIVAIEGGMYDPSVGLAMRIARVFAVPVEQVFTLMETEDKRGSGGRGKGKGAQ